MTNSKFSNILDKCTKISCISYAGKEISKSKKKITFYNHMKYMKYSAIKLINI